MEPSTSTAARRSEDIALDLLKFVSAHANLGGKSASSTTGFGIPSTAKSDDQVAQIFDLYARCRAAVESPTHLDSSTKSAK
jgi:hypothetical protein